MRNAIIDHYRRNATEQRRIDSVSAVLGNETLPEVESDSCQCFMALLPAMKPEYHEMIEQLELGQEDPEAAAARLGIERKNLKARRHRARQPLKERLEETCRSCAEHGCLDCTCKNA